jgi:hypothetical protein
MFSRITESFPIANQDSTHKHTHTAASIAERDHTIAALRKGLMDAEQEQHQRIATLVQQLEVCILTRVQKSVSVPDCISDEVTLLNIGHGSDGPLSWHI